MCLLVKIRVWLGDAARPSRLSETAGLVHATEVVISMHGSMDTDSAELVSGHVARQEWTQSPRGRSTLSPLSVRMPHSLSNVL